VSPSAPVRLESPCFVNSGEERGERGGEGVDIVSLPPPVDLESLCLVDLGEEGGEGGGGRVVTVPPSPPCPESLCTRVEGGLIELRRSVRDRVMASSMCDTEGFTAQVELAYRCMWLAYIQ